MSYVGIGATDPNHPLEVEGQVFISNVEQGNTTNMVPFEVYSDYTGKATLTDSRQLRLRVTPSSTSDTYHADMGLDNVDGNVFFISNPVTGTTSGDRDVFNIKDDGNVYISHLDVNSLTAVDPTFNNAPAITDILVTGTITASNIVGGSPLTLSSDSNVQVNTDLSVSSNLQVGDTITVGADLITIKEISASKYQTALVDTDGLLWGTGFKGYLGVNSSSGNYTTFTKIPTIVPVEHVACGLSHTMIIGTDRTVSGTGWSDAGQLGVPNIGPYNTFTSSSVTASQIACGSAHTMIIGPDGTVSGTGWNGFGQIGLGAIVNLTRSFETTSVTASKIVCGSEFTMILDSDGIVYGCGNNEWGQLGIGTNTDTDVFTSASVTASQIACGQYHSMIIGTDGTVSGTGYNIFGQLGIGTNTDTNVFTSASVTASQIACGQYHSMIIGTGQTVYGTGINNNGELGIGNTVDQTTFTSASVTASHIACGYYHTMIIGTNETVSGAGANNLGQLGLGGTLSTDVFLEILRPYNNEIFTFIDKTSNIYIGESKIGYFDDKLNLGFPGYYTTIDATGNMSVTGYLSKGSGTFNIPHPLPSMEDSHRLVHSFIEGPNADLIYRGESTLTNGSSTINIDQVSNMTQGTFQALTRDVQLFTTNLSSWDSVKGSVDGNIITIESENPESNASASWIVVAERNDRTFIESNLTNDEGVFIVEKQNIDN